MGDMLGLDGGYIGIMEKKVSAAGLPKLSHKS